eukprot:scaffold56570_cov34-Tisochrysis_lutea.AAC.6
MKIDGAVARRVHSQLPACDDECAIETIGNVDCARYRHCKNSAALELAQAKVCGSVLTSWARELRIDSFAEPCHVGKPSSEPIDMPIRRGVPSHRSRRCRGCSRRGRDIGPRRAAYLGPIAECKLLLGGEPLALRLEPALKLFNFSRRGLEYGSGQDSGDLSNHCVKRAHHPGARLQLLRVRC